MNLSAAMQMRVRRDATPEQVREIVNAIDATAKIIERI
jgi:hypothetical protein